MSRINFLLSKFGQRLSQATILSLFRSNTNFFLIRQIALNSVLIGNVSFRATASHVCSPQSGVRLISSNTNCPSLHFIHSPMGFPVAVSNYCTKSLHADPHTVILPFLLITKFLVRPPASMGSPILSPVSPFHRAILLCLSFDTIILLSVLIARSLTQLEHSTGFPIALPF